MKPICQPHHDKLGKHLIDDLNSGKYSSFMFFVAYARISGIEALYDAIQSFRAAGGTISAAIGIDQRNTSCEALRAVLDFAEDLHIVHNRSVLSTYHPKAYVLIGEKHGKIYVGSNNLTNGGLYTNYEIAVWEEFDLTVPALAEEFANMVRIFGSFFQEGPCCKRAGDELIKKLYDNHMILTEDEIRAINKRDDAVKAGAAEDAIFGTEPVTGHLYKHDFSHLTPAVQVRAEYQAAVDAAGESLSGEAAEAEMDAGPSKSFYKRLSRNDVDLKSSPGQIIIPIAFKTFFEPFSEPQKTKAAMQSERYFNLKYENSGEIVENARVIFYVPSPEHPRKNSEVRFALRNRNIFGEFQQNDVLVFTQAPKSKRGQYAYMVKRIAQNSLDRGSYSKRFDWIVE